MKKINETSFLLRITLETKEKIRQASMNFGIPISHIIRLAIDQFFKSLEEKN